MHPEVATVLACPHDGGPIRHVADHGRVLGCTRGHRFDVARQGYVSLLRDPRRYGGDPAELVDRRSRVHQAGVLSSIHRAVVAAADQPGGRFVCDIGSGPGTYLAAVLDALPEHLGLAVDVSKAAARRAARCHPRAGAVVADVWSHLPIRDGSIDLLLVVFAPRSPAEFARVLAPGGTLVVATPGSDHLCELRQAFGTLQVPSDKPARLDEGLRPWFAGTSQHRVRELTRVDGELAADLAAMGPSGHHLDAAALQAGMASLGGGTDVTLEVTVNRYTRRAQAGDPPGTDHAGPTAPTGQV